MTSLLVIGNRTWSKLATTLYGRPSTHCWVRRTATVVSATDYHNCIDIDCQHSCINIISQRTILSPAFKRVSRQGCPHHQGVFIETMFARSTTDIVIKSLCANSRTIHLQHCQIFLSSGVFLKPWKHAVVSPRLRKLLYQTSDQFRIFHFCQLL